MDILETNDILVKWIHSCDREEQLDELNKFIPEILITLFERSEKKEVIKDVITFLLQEMDNQRGLIKRLFFNSLPDKN